MAVVGAPGCAPTHPVAHQSVTSISAVALRMMRGEMRCGAWDAFTPADSDV